MTIERIHFKLINMPCCGHLLCWVNPRFPSYCPSCGRLIYPDVKQGVMQEDPEAELHININKGQT